jgi:hypothetical protein
LRVLKLETSSQEVDASSSLARMEIAPPRVKQQAPLLPTSASSSYDLFSNAWQTCKGILPFNLFLVSDDT